jgi:hypothetical protein
VELEVAWQCLEWQAGTVSIANVNLISFEASTLQATWAAAVAVAAVVVVAAAVVVVAAVVVAAAVGVAVVVAAAAVEAAAAAVAVEALLWSFQWFKAVGSTG